MKFAGIIPADNYSLLAADCGSPVRDPPPCRADGMQVYNAE